MKNLVSSWSIKQRVLIATMFAFTLAVFAVASTFFASGTIRSVEFGLAEVSPRGEAGGYAVPASGESTGAFQVTYGCSGGPGSPAGTQSGLIISFTYSSFQPPSNTSLVINGSYYGPLTGEITQNGTMHTITRYFWYPMWNFPPTGSYTVLFTGQFGTGGYDNPIRPFSYTASVTPNCGYTGSGASVDLKVRNNTAGTGWVDGPININTTDDLDLSWTSRNVVSCSGNNFTVPGNAVSGTQTSVVNPASGASRTYTILCGSDGSGTVSDSVVVNATGPGTGGPPTLTGTPAYVIKGDTATLTWSLNGNTPASCQLTGPGVNLSSLPNATGPQNVTINGESTYTLTCPGGIDTATIRVLPVLQET